MPSAGCVSSSGFTFFLCMTFIDKRSMTARVLFLNDEDALLNRLWQGDEDVLASLFEANRRAIVFYVLRNSGSRDDAEDILQEALVILWERVRAGTFIRGAKLSTFIFGIARHLWLRRLARRRHETPLSDDAIDRADPDASPLDELIENETTTAVQHAMDCIGHPCRELLLLYYWEDRSMKDIAVELGFRNAATVKTRKYQCKKRLEALLTEILGSDEGRRRRRIV